VFKLKDHVEVVEGWKPLFFFCILFLGMVDTIPTSFLLFFSFQALHNLMLEFHHPNLFH
jgi:hypothetical protein